MHVGCVCEYTLRVCMCGCTLHLNGLAVADIDKLDDPQASHRMLHCRVRCIDMPQMCDVHSYSVESSSAKLVVVDVDSKPTKQVRTL